MKPLFSKKPVLIPYVTLGDPDIPYTEKLVRYLIEQGVRIIEIGVPFSDPIADGPVIQASHFRALNQNPSLSSEDAFRLIASFKKTSKNAQNDMCAFVMMMSVNLIHHYGIEAFFSQASKSNVAGVIIPDLPIEEEGDYADAAKRHNVMIIRLLSYLTTGQRFNDIVDGAQGFLYLIATTGTTGERSDFNAKLESVIRKIKQRRPDLPVAIGFGISSKAQILQANAIADAAIVGSAITKRLEQSDFSEDFATILAPFFDNSDK